VSAESGRKTKKDRIVEELRALIASGEIARGARVQQDELASRFATSITPVREALRQLEAEGLLVSEPHRGVRVAFAKLEEVRDVYAARRLLEPYAAQRAAIRVSRRDLSQAEALLASMVEARRAKDDRGVLEANRAFHFLFYDRCGMPGLTNLINGLWLAFPWDILQVISHRVGESVAEREAMLAAVADGDQARVRQTFETHIAHSYEALARHLSERAFADPFDIEVD
jgi:DNA-binding GntR family transcriptional regulator